MDLISSRINLTYEMANRATVAPPMMASWGHIVSMVWLSERGCSDIKLTEEVESWRYSVHVLAPGTRITLIDSQKRKRGEIRIAIMKAWGF